MHWNSKSILSYNCLFNIVIGPMGVGKTYHLKYKAIKNALDSKGTFILLRRTERELQKTLSKFFDDIAIAFCEYEFRIKKDELQASKDGKNWNIIGYACYLSGARTQKSTSYSSVKTIIFDEFIIPPKKRSKYIPDEVKTFLEFYESVARMRDVIVWFVANALSAYNPYFLFWNITPPKRGIKRVSDEIAIEMIYDEEYVEAKKKSRFGKIINGTEFEKIAYGNEFIEDAAIAPLIKKGKNDKYFMTILAKGEILAIYKNDADGYLLVSENYDKSYPISYTLIQPDGTVNRLIKINRARYCWINALFDSFVSGLIKFETHKARECFYDIMRNFI